MWESRSAHSRSQEAEETGSALSSSFPFTLCGPTCGGTTHIQGGSCLILTGNTLTNTPSSVFYNSVNQVDEINRDNCIQRYVLQKGFGRSSVAMCALNPSTWEECEGSRPAWVILARPCLKKPNPMNLG